MLNNTMKVTKTVPKDFRMENTYGTDAKANSQKEKKSMCSMVDRKDHDRDRKAGSEDSIDNAAKRKDMCKYVMCKGVDDRERSGGQADSEKQRMNDTDSAQMPSPGMQQIIAPSARCKLPVLPQTGLSQFLFDNVRKVLVNDAGKPIVNFYIEITQINSFYDDKTDMCMDKLISYVCNVWQGGNMRRHEFTNKKIEEVMNCKIINQIPGAVSFCDNKSELTNMLYSYVNNLIFLYQGKDICTYGHSGWKNIQGGLMAYVTSDGVIGYPELPVISNDGVRIRNTCNAPLYNEFLKMRMTLKRPEHMDAILIYTFGQYLHRIFEDAHMGFKHVLFVVGPRGCGKTTVSLCFTQLDGKESPKFNFQATESGIQAHLMDYRDRVMLIDDLAPSADPSDKKQKERKLEMILRLFGDAGERIINTNFMKTNADKIDYSVQGGAVITGEYFYSTGSESSIARAVVVNLERDSVRWDNLFYFQRWPQLLESIVCRFIEFASKNYVRAVSTICETVENYRNGALQSRVSNRRFCEYLGQYMAVGKLLMDFFAWDSGITSLQQQDYLMALENGIKELLLENDYAMRQKAPINEILMAFIYLLDSGNVGKWGMPFSEDVPLVQYDGMLYFRQKDLPDMKKRYVGKVNIPYISMSSIEIGNLLEAHGYCQPYYEGGKKRRGKRYKEYGKERLMCIPMSKIYEFQETMMTDY